MDMSSSTLIVLIGVPLIINLLVSILVVRSPFYSLGQKLTQCAIVWLIPLFGAIGIWAFLRAQYDWKKYDTRAYPEPSQKMIAIEISDAIHGNFGDGGTHGCD